MKFNLLLSIALVSLVTMFLSATAALAQDAVAPNAVCLAETCLTGVSAVVITVFTALVTAATLALKFVAKDSKFGKILDKIANIKVSK